MIPVVHSHHLKPDIGLVRVWWDSAQEGQVDALQGTTKAKHRLLQLILAEVCLIDQSVPQVLGKDQKSSNTGISGDPEI